MAEINHTFMIVKWFSSNCWSLVMGRGMEIYYSTKTHLPWTPCRIAINYHDGVPIKLDLDMVIVARLWCYCWIILLINWSEIYIMNFWSKVWFLLKHNKKGPMNHGFIFYSFGVIAAGSLLYLGLIKKGRKVISFYETNHLLKIIFIKIVNWQLEERRHSVVKGTVSWKTKFNCQ